MTRVFSLFCTLFLMLSLFGLPAAAQTPSAQLPPGVIASTTTPSNKDIPAGKTVRAADGKAVQVGEGGSAAVSYTGKLRRDPNDPNGFTCDTIESVTVKSGGAHSITVTGQVNVTIERSGTTCTSEPGAPNGNGANITVQGADNTVINANGKGTAVTISTGSKNTSITGGPTSSGDVSYPKSGFSGSFTSQQGGGPWTMTPR